MKRIILLPVIFALTLTGYSQKSIDELFDKYTGTEGFTSITISGNLIKLLREFDNDKSDDERSWPADITTVRILAQNDDDEWGDIDFYGMVEKEIVTRNYEEFMRVKEYKQDLVMLVKADGKKLKEFLIVAGGRDNFLMQIKGNMTYDEAKRFSESMKIDKGVNISISSR